MERNFKDIIKDIIISILIVICILLIITVIIYNKISIGRVIQEPEEYALSSEMQNEIDDNGDTEIKQTIHTYTLDATELKKYEQTKEYNKGKVNPFAKQEDFEEVQDTDENTTSSTGFYQDDGTK